MHSLLFANIPYNFTADELRSWIEGRGISVTHLRLITDLVSGTSPSFAEVQLVNGRDAEAAARLLDGQRLNNHILRVKPVKLLDTSRPMRRVKATA